MHVSDKTYKDESRVPNGKKYMILIIYISKEQYILKYKY